MLWVDGCVLVEVNVILVYVVDWWFEVVFLLLNGGWLCDVVN